MVTDDRFCYSHFDVYKMHTCFFVQFCPVYYLKATFGPRSVDAVLEIPVSVTGNDSCLSFEFQISSPKIELVVLQSKGGYSLMSKIWKYRDQHSGGRWSNLNFNLDSDVDVIQLVAKKIGVTTNVEYVLVDVLKIDKCYVKSRFRRFELCIVCCRTFLMFLWQNMLTN